MIEKVGLSSNGIGRCVVIDFVTAQIKSLEAKVEELKATESPRKS